MSWITYWTSSLISSKRRAMLLLLLFLALSSSATASIADGLQCQKVASLYASTLGLYVDDVAMPGGNVAVPLPSGTHLEVCPQSRTCCTAVMEKKLLATAAKNLKSALDNEYTPKARQLDARISDMQRLIRELINGSYSNLDVAFKRIYGYSYVENKDTFTQFYERLGRYMDGSGESISQMVQWLLDTMSVKIYSLMLLNYNFDQRYSDCVKTQLRNLNVLGQQTDRELNILIKAMITTRHYLYGLLTVSDLLKQAPELSMECQRAALRAHYCAWCAGQPQVSPCTNLCVNVLTGCLAQQAPLAAPWKSLITGLVDFSPAVEGTGNLFEIMEQIHIKISDGIMHMQEQEKNLQIQGKVNIACGSPPLKTNKPRSKRQTSDQFGWEYGQKPGASKKDPKEAAFRKLVKDTSKQLLGLKDLFTWQTLATERCPDLAVTTACWNGTAVGSYRHMKMQPDLASQAANPEVSQDTSHPLPDVRIKELKLKKMREMLLNVPRSGFKTVAEPVVDPSISQLLTNHRAVSASVLVPSGSLGSGDSKPLPSASKAIAGGSGGSERPAGTVKPQVMRPDMESSGSKPPLQPKPSGRPDMETGSGSERPGPVVVTQPPVSTTTSRVILPISTKPSTKPPVVTPPKPHVTIPPQPGSGDREPPVTPPVQPGSGDRETPEPHRPTPEPHRPEKVTPKQPQPPVIDPFPRPDDNIKDTIWLPKEETADGGAERRGEGSIVGPRAQVATKCPHLDPALCGRGCTVKSVPLLVALAVVTIALLRGISC